jgi:hypothetical protein
VSGLAGRTFGTAPNTLFLPAASYRYYDSSGKLYAGANGSYWSTAAGNSGTAYRLSFDINAAEWLAESYDNNRANGYSIRCVAE